MDWQQTAAVVIVAIAAGWFAVGMVRRRKPDRTKSGFGCGWCCAGRSDGQIQLLNVQDNPTLDMAERRD